MIEDYKVKFDEWQIFDCVDFGFENQMKKLMLFLRPEDIDIVAFRTRKNHR